LSARRPASLAASVGILLASGPELPLAAQIPDLQRSVIEARDKVAPAVVNVQPITEVFSSGEKQRATAIGSGFLFDPAGHVVTNYHVAGRAKQLIITLSSKQRVPGELVGGDPLTDIAVLRIDPEKLAPVPKPVELGDSDRLEVGEYVVALGSPLALQRSLSLGVVSSTDRFLSDEFKLPTGERTGSFNTWIQTDAAINPGNSGGPLVNLGGQVVGVNARGAFGASSIGFAIPINIVKEVVSEIIAHGRVRRSWLGLEFQPREELSHFLDGEPGPGVVIRSIEPDSPAERSGIRAGDLLLQFNGQTVSARFHEELPAIYKLIADTPVGTPVPLVLLRDSASLSVSIETAERSEASADEIDCKRWGFTASEITREFAMERNLPNQQGVLIGGVKPNGPAFRARLLPGDVLTEIEGEAVAGLEALQSIYQKLSETSPKVLLAVRRQQARWLVLIEVGDEP
jgi:serine protease Do